MLCFKPSKDISIFASFVLDRHRIWSIVRDGDTNIPSIKMERMYFVLFIGTTKDREYRLENAIFNPSYDASAPGLLIMV